MLRQINALADRVLSRMVETGDASAAANCYWKRRCFGLLSNNGPNDDWCKRWCCLDENGNEYCEECIC